MLFNSWEFVSLVVVTAILYYLPVLRKWQVYILLLSSFVFYSFDSFWLLLLLLASSIINAITSYAVKLQKQPRLYASMGVVLNLLILASFKYIGMLSSLFLYKDTDLGYFLCSLPLPIGISFYTFSGISLLVDTFRSQKGQVEVQHTPFWSYLRDTLLYICFFPKLLAGPIVKAKDFFGEIELKVFKQLDYAFIFKTLVIGYFLKMVVADNLKDYTFWMPFRYSCYFGSGSLLTLLFGYSAQMFADFAGYSLIAIGIGAIFGYRLPTNFYFPYISSSFREFWKRWHITLSQFLMDYLYISLGGNRKGKLRTYANLLLTMMLGGLWHGAAWSFLVWGTYHGFCLVIERIICTRRQNCIEFGTSQLCYKLSRSVSILFVFIMVSLGWLLFKLPFGDAVHFVLAILTNFCVTDWFDLRFLPIIIYSMPVLLYHIAYLVRQRWWFRRYVLRYEYVVYGFLLFLILTNSGSVSQFVYFQF